MWRVTLPQLLCGTLQSNQFFGSATQLPHPCHCLAASAILADLSSGWIEGGGNGCCGHSIDWLYSVRGRAGLASGDNRWLFYATGGVAWADIAYRSDLGGHSDTQFGWVAGGGVERMLTPNLTARVEYLYYDFDSVTAPAGSLGGSTADLDPTLHTVRFGLNFKF